MKRETPNAPLARSAPSFALTGVRRHIALAAALCGVAAQAAQPLGKLFFTPQERAALEQSRSGGKAAPVQRQAQPAPPRAPPQIAGYVRRGDGRATVWVDGEPRYSVETRARLDPSIVDTPRKIVVQRAEGIKRE